MVPMELEPPNGEPASLDLYRRPLLAIFVDSSLGIRAFYELPSIPNENQFRLLTDVIDEYYFKAEETQPYSDSLLIQYRIFLIFPTMFFD